MFYKRKSPYGSIIKRNRCPTHERLINGIQNYTTLKMDKQIQKQHQFKNAIIHARLYVVSPCSINDNHRMGPLLREIDVQHMRD